MYARKGKRDCSNGNEEIFRHIFSLQKNASTFDIKRKCVLDGTQEHFFYEQKQNEILNGKGHKKRSSAELQPLLTLNLIL